MKEMGFFYDMARCTGCRACQVACKEKNKLAAGEFCRRADAIEITMDGKGEWVHFSGACNHCADPACMAVCPTGAMYRADDGTVQHKDALCIGCGRCVHHCPYGAAFLNKYTGYAQKCDACVERRQNGREPACVEACPMRALHFGELDALRERFGPEHGAGLPFLPGEEMTSPSLLVRGAPAQPKGEKAAAKAETEEVTLSGSAADIVILGSGAAAVSAVQEIRRRSKTAKVTIISREKRLPYSRPMLSKGLAGSFAMDRYPIVEESWFQENHVTYIGGAEIAALDASGHTVTLADGRSIPYDKCIYALGMDCFVPPIPGRELPGAFTLRYDRDLHRIRQTMLVARYAVVIGGGITGMEFAWELKKSGLQVTVLDLTKHLMERFLDEHSSKLLRRAVEKAGIQVETNVRIKAIAGESRVEGVLLEDGRTYPADLVILSTGYRANTALAAGAGLAVGQAVMVNEKMETSDPDIYACGDCVDRSTATWVQSIAQGKIAGANALGAGLRYEAAAEPVMVHTSDTSLLMVGDMGKQPGENYRFVYGYAAGDSGRFYVNPRTAHRGETHFTFCFHEDRLVGIAMVGSLELMLLAQRAVDERWDLATLKKAALEKGVEINEG